VHTEFFFENLKKGDHCEDIGVGGSLMLNYSLRNRTRESGLDSPGLR
jgi:hypothetical protein